MKGFFSHFSIFGRWGGPKPKMEISIFFFCLRPLGHRPSPRYTYRPGRATGGALRPAAVGLPPKAPAVFLGDVWGNCARAPPAFSFSVGGIGIVKIIVLSHTPAAFRIAWQSGSLVRTDVVFLWNVLASPQSVQISK